MCILGVKEEGDFRRADCQVLRCAAEKGREGWKMQFWFVFSGSYQILVCWRLFVQNIETGDTFEKHLDKIIVIFKVTNYFDFRMVAALTLIYQFLEDKDVFLTFYSNCLAKRLIFSKSSDDLESAMISRLRVCLETHACHTHTSCRQSVAMNMFSGCSACTLTCT